MKLVDCDERRHSAAILAIFNDAIANSTRSTTTSREPRNRWRAGSKRRRRALSGHRCEDADGSAHGLRSYGQFREWPAYKYTVEHSVYVDARFRGQGHGRVLLEAVIAAALGQDYHVMVGGIDAANAVSIRLHERLGFTHCGTVKQAGFKFGRWLDLAFYQRILATPATPVDG